MKGEKVERETDGGSVVVVFGQRLGEEMGAIREAPFSLWSGIASLPP